MEANPTSVELQKFRDYSNTAINRISIGVQSLDNDDLKILVELIQLSWQLRQLVSHKNTLSQFL
ncbi:MAG: hypothetical protein CM15mP111_2370 [Hyphomicrobiales bacterium]|nr:MAG: hypothetical protein CM15mP111_2370 [Hyphomicrobiales bacterium]